MSGMQCQEPCEDEAERRKNQTAVQAEELCSRPPSDEDNDLSGSVTEYRC